MRVYSKLTANGPIKIPSGPKSEIPPKTENKIRRGGISIFLPIKRGVKKLSIVETTTIAQIRRPMALPV